MPNTYAFLLNSAIYCYFQVSAAGQTAQGSGPNKKLAKRAAAEALLQLMGYSRPSLQPGKPALKTSHSNGSTASTTSSSSMSCTSLTNGEVKEKTKKVRLFNYLIQLMFNRDAGLLHISWPI